jgi:hypothetical protein
MNVFLVFFRALFFASLSSAEFKTIEFDKPLRIETVRYSENQIQTELFARPKPSDPGLLEIGESNRTELWCKHYEKWITMHIAWALDGARGALIKIDKTKSIPKCNLATLKNYPDLPIDEIVDQKYFYDSGFDYGEFAIFSELGKKLLSARNIGPEPKFFKSADKIGILYSQIIGVSGFACSLWPCSSEKDIEFWKTFNKNNGIPSQEPPPCLKEFLKKNGIKTPLQIAIPVTIEDLSSPHNSKKDFGNIRCEIPG